MSSSIHSRLELERPVLASTKTEALRLVKMLSSLAFLLLEVTGKGLHAVTRQPFLITSAPPSVTKLEKLA